MILWAIWNLFLAAVPVALGVAVARGIEGRRTGRGTSRGALAALALSWLLFLPNTAYLLTEMRHFLFDPPWRAITAHGAHDRDAMFASAAWGALFAGYGLAGLVLFTLALRPVERAARGAGRLAGRLSPVLFPLVSLGVYLGLVYRLNSWDAFARPGLVLGCALDTLLRVRSVGAILVFGAVLWAAHRAIDLVVDGLVSRVRGRAQAAGSRAAASDR